MLTWVAVRDDAVCPGAMQRRSCLGLDFVILILGDGDGWLDYSFLPHLKSFDPIVPDIGNVKKLFIYN